MLAEEKTNVFLSYVRHDRDRAGLLVKALEQHGISIFWDVDIPAGVDWQSYLHDRIAASQCVIVLFSRASMESEFVRVEAEAAVRRNVFLPVLLDKVELPRPFNRFQAASLVDWDGNPGDRGVQRIVEAIHWLRKTAPAAPEETRGYKASERSVRLRAEDLFQRNLRSEALIEHVEIEDSALHKSLSWNITPGVNVMLGRNGFGKTQLLRAILALLQYDDESALQGIGRGSATISILQNDREESVRYSDQFFDEEKAVGKVPVLAIPDTRFVNRSITTLGAVADEATGKGDRADLARYGAAHFLAERPYDNMIHGFLYGLCLDYFENGLNFDGEQFALIRDVVRELTDQTFDFDRVAREGRDRFTLYVRTEGNEDNPLPIQKCSQGTSSVIAMFGLIYDFLASLQHGGSLEIRRRRGIVVIDEVDAHLHPIWQQKIVSLLRDRFPRVQFIITAHNPTVVAGCGEDEVCVLRRRKDREFSLVQFPNDFIGWQTEEIYRKVFGIENPDPSFMQLDAMRPFKARLRDEAEALAGGGIKTPEQEHSLQTLEDKLLRIENVEGARSQRVALEELERENRILRDRLLGVEAAHDAARESQQQLDEVRGRLHATENELQAQTQNMRRGIVVALLIVGFVAMATVAFSIVAQLLRNPISLGGAAP
jgi:predicted ATPase